MSHVHFGHNDATVVVDLTHTEGMRHEAKSEGLTLIIDEPPSRGGTDAGMNPLSLFVAGAASCFLTQLVRVAQARHLKMDGIQITAKAHHDKREFTDVIYDVRLTGSEGKENALELLRAGEDRCFPNQTLKKAIPVTYNLSLNGNHLTSHTMGPDLVTATSSVS